MAVQINEMNHLVTYRDQVQHESVGPIVLVAKFNVADSSTVDAFVENWADTARHMKEQPGFISSQFHRGVAGSTSFLNYAQWESVRSLADANRTPEFQRLVAEMPDGVSLEPHIFHKVAVSNLCLGS